MIVPFIKALLPNHNIPLPILKGLFRGAKINLNPQCSLHNCLVGAEVKPGMTTIDAVANKFGTSLEQNRALIKIDVEGAELKVIEGASLVGNLDQLTDQLEYLAKWLPTNPELRQKARSCVEHFSFSSFRNKLRSVLCLSHVS